MGTLNQMSKVDQIVSSFIQAQDLCFEQGSFCSCGERMYRVIVKGANRGEYCPKCSGEIKVKDLL